MSVMPPLFAMEPASVSAPAPDLAMVPLLTTGPGTVKVEVAGISKVSVRPA